MYDLDPFRHRDDSLPDTRDRLPLCAPQLHIPSPSHSLSVPEPSTSKTRFAVRALTRATRSLFEIWERNALWLSTLIIGPTSFVSIAYFDLCLLGVKEWLAKWLISPFGAFCLALGVNALSGLRRTAHVEYDEPLFLRIYWILQSLLWLLTTISVLLLPDDGFPSLQDMGLCLSLGLTCAFAMEANNKSRSYIPGPYTPPRRPPEEPVSLEVLRGRIIIDVCMVQKKICDDAPPETCILPWGGVSLPESVATLHFAAIGATGSGKSVTHALLMESALRSPKRRNVRGIVYDAKRDAISMLSRIAGPRNIAVLNPFDARSLAWDIARDVIDVTGATQLAETLIPRSKYESQPFFNNAARDLLSGVIIALQRKSPERWELRDVLHILADERSLRSVLLSTGETAHYVSEYFKPKSTFQNIRSAVACQMAQFRPIAAAWHNAAAKGLTFSLRDWMTSPRVLILGEDETNRAALAAVNRLLFTRATELLLNQPDRPTTRTWVFLDEVRDLGHLDTLDRLLLKGRSKNVCVTLGFQDIEGLREVYGDKVANEIVGQCGHLAFLKLNSPTTAEWASQAMGEQEVLERIPSRPRSRSQDERPPDSKQVKTRRVVLPSQLLNIEPPSGLDRLTGYYLTANYGLYSSTLTHRQIGPVAELRDEAVADYVQTPATRQLLIPWSDVERERVGLDSTKSRSHVSQINPDHSDLPNPRRSPAPNQQCEPIDIPRMTIQQNGQNPT